MMSLFSKSKHDASIITTTVAPCRAALKLHLRKMSALNSRMLKLGERMAVLQRDIDGIAIARAAVERVKQTIAAKKVAALVADEIEPDQSAEQAELTVVEQRFSEAQSRGDIALKALLEIQAQRDALRGAYVNLQPPLAHLTLDALAEEMATLHPALMAAQAAFLEVHRKVFVIAAAIDRHSTDHRMGVFVDAGRYCKRFVPLPMMEPFEPIPKNPIIAGQIEHARVQGLEKDQVQLEQEAQALIGRLLRGESDD